MIGNAENCGRWKIMTIYFPGIEQRVNVVRIVTAGYSPENFTADLALLQLSPPLKLDGKVAPICLPNSNKKYLPGT